MSLPRLRMTVVTAAAVGLLAAAGPAAAAPTATNVYYGDGTSVSQAYDWALTLAESDGYTRSQCTMRAQSEGAGWWEVTLTCTR